MASAPRFRELSLEEPGSIVDVAGFTSSKGSVVDVAMRPEMECRKRYLDAVRYW